MYTDIFLGDVSHNTHNKTINLTQEGNTFDPSCFEIIFIIEWVSEWLSLNAFVGQPMYSIQAV